MPVRTITLRAGTVVATALIAGVPLAGIASAAPAADRDCRDFPSQATAQAALIANPSDPDGLDRDRDGIACEDSVYASPGVAAPNPASGEPAPGNAPATGEPSTGTASPSPDQVPAVPVGSIDAGDGSSTAAGPATDVAASFVLVGFGAVVATGAGAAVWRTRRSASRGATAQVPAPRTAADDLVPAGAPRR